MSSVDERAWLPDELWTQVRPPPARFRVTISAAILAIVVGAVVLSQIGFFHPRIFVSYEQESARGNRLTVVLTLYDGVQVPAHVTGFRAAQPGARIVSAHLNGVVPRGPHDNPDPQADPAPDGARVAPFTLHGGQSEIVTLVYAFDCAKLRAPLRVNIETQTFLGNQTSTAMLASSTSGPLRQVCAAA